MIISDIQIEGNGVKYTIPIRSKYTILTGNGAIGKSSVLKIDWDRVTTSKKVTRFLGFDDITMLALKSGINAIYLVDEDIIEELTNEDAELFHKSACQFLLIGRNTGDKFSVDYRDILTLRQSGKYYRAVRMYPDLDKFIEHNSYLCEDKKSGYLYFSNRLQNVRSAEGKDNIPDIVKKDDLIIADGAAFGHLIRELYGKYDLYLPISFEYLCCKALKPNHPAVQENIHKSIDPSKFISLEGYYTAVLMDFCKQLGKQYTKSNCPEFIKQLDLLQ